MKVKPLGIVVVSAVALPAAPLVTGAQQAGKVYRIGWLATSTPLSHWRDIPAAQAFLDGLRQLGYEEGRNLVVDVLSAEGKLDRLPDLAAELVRRKPDVPITAACGAPLSALRTASGTIPIVVQTCQDDMVAAGVVASLARPGGNITGISKASPEWAAKRPQLLKEAVGSASRVAIPWTPGYTDWSAGWRGRTI